jgi:ATP-dependent Clp protease ATP-binding subunit ClpC
MRKTLMEQLKRQFRPEFINRVDSIIVFRQLSQADIRQIVNIIMNEVNERLVEYELKLEATPAASEWLAKHGYDAEFGARPLRRLVQTEIEDRLSDSVLSGKFKNGEVVVIDVDNEDQIVLRHKEGVEGVVEEVLPA